MRAAAEAGAAAAVLKAHGELPPALVDVARSSGAAVLGFASSGLPGPKGNRETFVWLAEPDRPGAVDDVDAAAREVEPS